MTDYAKQRQRLFTAVSKLSRYGVDSVATIMDRLDRLTEILPFEEAYKQLEDYYSGVSGM